MSYIERRSSGTNSFNYIYYGRKSTIVTPSADLNTFVVEMLTMLLHYLEMVQYQSSTNTCSFNQSEEYTWLVFHQLYFIKWSSKALKAPLRRDCWVETINFFKMVLEQKKLAEYLSIKIKQDSPRQLSQNLEEEKPIETLDLSPVLIIRIQPNNPCNVKLSS